MLVREQVKNVILTVCWWAGGLFQWFTWWERRLRGSCTLWSVWRENTSPTATWKMRSKSWEGKPHTHTHLLDPTHQSPRLTTISSRLTLVSIINSHVLESYINVWLGGKGSLTWVKMYRWGYLVRQLLSLFQDKSRERGGTGGFLRKSNTLLPRHATVSLHIIFTVLCFLLLISPPTYLYFFLAQRRMRDTISLFSELLLFFLI